MGSSRPDRNHDAAASARNAVPEQASHLAELGAMSQLYAHEVNNLLTQISSRAQLALMRPDDSELAAQALRAVGDCCDRITQLTQIFLIPNQHPTTAIDAQTQPGSSRSNQRAPIAAIHDQVCRSIRDCDRDRLGFTLHDETQGYAPDLMPLLLEQVLLNLMLNALRAVHEHPTPDAVEHSITLHATLLEPTGECSTWNTPAAGPSTGTMQLVVQDSGIGMSPTQITQLMNGLRVETSNAAHAERFTRHGLGLRVCRKLLDTVGGQLRCESTPMQGTRMRITIPAIKLDASATRAAA